MVKTYITICRNKVSRHLSGISMETFYKLLRPFIYPRYYEEGPPKYLDMAFLSKDNLEDGKIKEPVKSILDLVVFGYRPITSVSILSVLVANNNKPLYGAQIGKILEKNFELPIGWFTKTRYYDTRIGKLLKMLERQNILETVGVKDTRTNKDLIGYRICACYYFSAKDTINMLQRGQGLGFLIRSPAKQSIDTEKEESITKYCTKCKMLARSNDSKFCENCGEQLLIKCQYCGKNFAPEYSFCTNCGKKV
jgi:hypothetical protein